MLNLTEYETLRGYYNTAFFHMYLEGEFDLNLEELSIKDRGTFIHEYVHYYQNIATLWGLYSSDTRYVEMIQFKKQLFTSEDIEIPFKINYSENLRKRIDWIKIGDGTHITDSKKSWNIDITSKIRIKRNVLSEHERKLNTIKLTIVFDDGRSEDITLGAHIIKESMAAMYQSLIDPSAQHDDVPYNVIKILCKQHYNNISADIEKLICICFTSLFSMTPGYELINLLDDANINSHINGISIFSEFIEESTIILNNEDSSSVVDFFNKLVGDFKDSLSTNLIAELDFINEVLERAQLSNGQIPLLSILYDKDKLSLPNLNRMIGYLGIPYIQTSTMEFHFPKSAMAGNLTEISSQDIIEMIAQEAMFLYCTIPQKFNKICPLYYMCQGSKYQKDGCFGAPWEQPECIFTIVSSGFSLDKKNIIWKF